MVKRVKDELLNIIKKQNDLILYWTGEATKKYKQQVKEHTSLAITSALGLIIGLSWKDVITKVIDVYIKSRLATGSILGDFISALVLTAVCVAALVIIYHFLGNNEKKEAKKERKKEVQVTLPIA